MKKTASSIDNKFKDFEEKLKQQQKKLDEKVTFGRSLEQSISELYKTRDAPPKAKNKLRNYGK